MGPGVCFTGSMTVCEAAHRKMDANFWVRQQPFGYVVASQGRNQTVAPQARGSPRREQSKDVSPELPFRAGCLTMRK
jgi:hypothetical protein